MKKLIALILAICVIFSAFSLVCSAETDELEAGPCSEALSIKTDSGIGEITSADVKEIVFEPIEIIENTYGKKLSASGVAAANSSYFCYCDWTAFLNYTITLKNGDIIEAKNGYFTYSGIQYEFSYAHSHKNYEERFVVGETYTEKLTILGEEYEVEITIVPSPVTDIEIEPITILEGTKCDTISGASGDYCVYRWYEDMPWKITLNNGKTLESNSRVVIIDGKNYSFEYRDNQTDSNHWEAGDTNTCQATFLGFTVDIPVTISNTPIKNISFGEIFVYENADGTTYHHYNHELEEDQKFFKYRWEDYINYDVTFIDGTTAQGTGRYIYYNGDYIEIEYSDLQSYENQWKSGNSYPANLAVGGKNYTVRVKVLPNPVKSVNIANIVIPQGMNGETDEEYDPLVNDTFKYFRYNIAPFLDYIVTFNDNTTAEGNRYGFNYNGRHYAANVSNIQSYKNPLMPGKTYYITVDVLGFVETIPVYVKPIPEAEGFGYIVNNGKITIMECTKTDEFLVIPEKIGDYEVTEIQNISQAAKYFTKIYLPESIESLSWIDFTAFENLTTIYYAGGKYQWTDVSKNYNGFEGIEIIFNSKLEQEKAIKPVFKAKTQNSVTLTAVSGCEYSKDGVNWQKSNKFTGLKCSTAYTFYQRYAETDSHYAGEKSAVLKVTTGAHTYKTTTTKATLTKNGSIIKKCTVCGNVASNTAIKYPKTIKLANTSFVFNNTVRKPAVTVKDSSGKVMPASNYTVKYATGRKNVGTYKVTITFKGNYSGTKVLSFKITLPKFTLGKAASGFVKIGNKQYHFVNTKINVATKLVTVAGKQYYIKNGVRQSNTGLVKHGNYQYYVKSGIRQNNTGLIKHGSYYYYVKNGVRQKNTGLVKYGNYYYYVKNGVRQNNTGLVKYGNYYYYVSNGVRQNNTGIVKHGNYRYYVKNGVRQNTTGTVKIAGKSYKLVNGVVK